MNSTLVFGILILAPIAQAANYKCIDSENFLILERTSKENMPARAKMTWKGGFGFYGADCTLIKETSHITSMECAIQPEWNYFQNVAVINLAKDFSSAEIFDVISDRRFRTGYRLVNPLKLKCSSTKESVD